MVGNLYVHTYLLSFEMVLQHKFPFAEPKSGDISQNREPRRVLGRVSESPRSTNTRRCRARHSCRRGDPARFSDSAAKTSEGSRQLDFVFFFERSKDIHTHSNTGWKKNHNKIKSKRQQINHLI